MLLQISSSLHSESPTAKSTSPCSNRSLNSIQPIIKILLSPLLCSTARSLLNSNSLGGAQQPHSFFAQQLSSQLNSLFAQQHLIAQQRTTNVELIELARWQFYTDFLIEFMLVIATTCIQKTPINLNRALQKWRRVGVCSNRKFNKKVKYNLYRITTIISATQCRMAHTCGWRALTAQTV